MTPKRLLIHTCQAKISHKSATNTYTHPRHQESSTIPSRHITRVFANYNSHIRHFNVMNHNTTQERI